MNSSQKVIAALILSKKPMTKVELQALTKFSIHTLHDTMTILKRSGFVTEVLGKYMATPRAYELYKSDPNLESLAFNLVRPANGQKEVTESIDLNWDNLRRWEQCGNFLQCQDDWAKESRVTEAVEVFTLLGAIQSGQRFKERQVDTKVFPEEIAIKMKTIFTLLGEVTEWMNGFNPR